MKTTLSIVLAIILTISCAVADSSTDITKAPLLSLCAKARRGNSTALEELVRRKALPVNEFAFIPRQEVFVGMSGGGAKCALGPAQTINRTTTRSGESLQVVFPEGRRIRYLYIENGKVTAWQE